MPRRTRRCCMRCKTRESASWASGAGELLPVLQMFSPSALSRQLRRLLDLGVIKRVHGTYRYDLTKAGRAAIAAAERLTEAVVIPALV